MGNCSRRTTHLTVVNTVQSGAAPAPVPLVTAIEATPNVVAAPQPLRRDSWRVFASGVLVLLAQASRLQLRRRLWGFLGHHLNRLRDADRTSRHSNDLRRRWANLGRALRR